MNVTYGPGAFIRENVKLEGTIILSEHKIYVLNQGEELTPSFVPLEKIEIVRLSGKHMEVEVRPAIMSRYRAAFEGERTNIADLAKEIVRRRGFKKRFMKQEWYEVPS